MPRRRRDIEGVMFVVLIATLLACTSGTPAVTQNDPDPSLNGIAKHPSASSPPATTPPSQNTPPTFTWCSEGEPLAQCGAVRACRASTPTAVPEEVRERLGLDVFYQKHLDAMGVPIVSASEVDDRAFQEACAIIAVMLSKRPEVVAPLRANKVRVGIIGRNQVTSDMPEHHDLDTMYPGTDWDIYRGLGATIDRPLSSVGEENLLGLPRGARPDGDPYAGESIMVHEFAHTFLEMGVFFLPEESKAKGELTALYNNALAAGTFDDTYADDTWQEYWAEGVQTWFETNLTAEPPNGIHGPIDTRDELRANDPDLALFISRFFFERDFEELHSK